MRKKIGSLLALLFGALLLNAVELVQLNVDFEHGIWQELLPPLWGENTGAVLREPGNHALRLVPHSNRSTQKLPYAGGDIKIEFDAANSEINNAPDAGWKVGLVQITYYAGEQELGHQDLHYAAKPSGWARIKAERNRFKINSAADHFRVSFSNYGVSGELLIDNVNITVALPEKNLCGDQGFRGTPGLDHWFPAKEGVDWDGLPLTSPESRVAFIPNVLPGTKALHLTGGTGTVSSMRYAYDGEELIIGAWYRQQGVVTGSRGWCNAGIQIVYYNAEGEAVGHRDLLPLRPGNQPWRYEQVKIPAGNLGRAVKSFAVMIRLFDGGKGELWVGEVAAVKLRGSDRVPYDKQGAAVEIDAKNPETAPIRPVWNGADLSYAHQVLEPPVKTALAGLKAAGLRHLRLREFMNSLELIRGWSDDGKPVMDFTRVDRVMDAVVQEYGFLPTVTIESTPASIATKPHNSFCNHYPPRDPALWEEAVYSLLAHWVERYGKESLSQWMFECWNEPSSSGFFRGTLADYTTLVHHFLNAVSRIEQQYDVTLKCATASDVSISPWYRPVWNSLQGQKRLGQIDVVSMHLYGGYVSSFYSFGYHLNEINAWRDAYPELNGSELHITEFNGDSMSNRHCDLPVAGAFLIKAARFFLDNRVHQAYYFGVADFLYGKENRHFKGDLGVYTKTGIAKPVLNGFRLLRQLEGGHRLKLTSTNDPVDGLAVRMPDGGLRILLTTFAEADLDDDGPCRIRLSLQLPEGFRLKQPIRTRFFDRTHGNSYGEFLRCGSPAPAGKNDPLPAELNAANTLGHGTFDDYAITGDTLTATVTMPLNTGLLLELLPETEVKP